MMGAGSVLVVLSQAQQQWQAHSACDGTEDFVKDAMGAIKLGMAPSIMERGPTGSDTGSNGAGGEVVGSQGQSCHAGVTVQRLLAP